ncbi:MAG: hypothetical protein OXH22_03330 [Chloroflexi bacterium]|nr:hypothetical protein [Chloroflexota bacterium]
MKIADLFAASKPFTALVLAVLVSAGLFGLLALGSGGAGAQIQPSATTTPTATPTETPPPTPTVVVPTATPFVAGPVIVVETAIPEDWHVERANEAISVFEAFTSENGDVTFALRETSDSANFLLVPAGMSDESNHRAHLLLKEGVTLDSETQDTFSVEVLASAESGASTQVSLRLRITETDPGPQMPTPTPTATPLPLGDCGRAIEGRVSQGDWIEDDNCLSMNRPLSSRPGPGDYYARYFTFTLDEPATMSISLTSEVDTYLYLMRGVGSNGDIVAENDDALPRVDLNSSIRTGELPAGEYTIEATTYAAEKTGRFRLVVSGLPGAGEEPDCLTGGAVQDPETNVQLVAECEVLLELRPTLDGRGLLNWAADVPMDDWQGVTTGGSPLRVTELALAGSGLNGVIPSQLESLSGLETLSLSDNGLYGEIPGELGTLDNLTVLELDSNRLSGIIPAELGNLLALETLTLKDNELDGVIPHSLTSLVRLQVLRLGNNDLTGEIPAGFSDLHHLRVLDLADNQLTGAIPTELDRLSHLEEVKIAGNSFSGCVPSSFEAVADNDTARLGLPFCPSGICFDKPAVPNPFENAGLVGDCNALLDARILLEGTLGEDVARLNWSFDKPIEEWEGITISGLPRRVIRLALPSRGLNGRMSSQLSELDELSVLQLDDNNLSDSLPSSFGKLTKLQILILGNNSISGAIPSAIGDMSSLHYVSLKGNMISGEIPPELSILEELASVDLKDNRLTGAIPGELGSLPNLRSLHLDDNMLSGEIPPELAGISLLENLSLERNMLSGHLPPELGSLANLRVLALADNTLSGEIPDELGDISNLSDLYLRGNEFVGCIPKELKDIPRNDFRALDLEYCGGGECADSMAVQVANGADHDRLVSDCNTLLSLQEMLQGEDGARTLNWAVGVPMKMWEGITIGTTQTRVEGLDLSREDNTTTPGPLTGVIPHEIKHLAKLVSLKLSNNMLGSDMVGDDAMPYGGIPDKIGTLTDLKTLLLDGNILHGEIPKEIGNLANLKTLLLANNMLTGEIPTELTMLERLANISLSGNALEGCIPDALEDIAHHDLAMIKQSDSNTDGLPLCSESDDSED